MKILVIGSHSELGQLVSYRLAAEGHTILGFDNYRPQDFPPNALIVEWADAKESFEEERVQKAEENLLAFAKVNRYTRYLGDVRDGLAVSEAISISDGVIHLGSINDAEELEGTPVAVQINLLGAFNVFQACAQHIKRCSYLVPESAYNAANAAYMFNRKHNTEIAVVLPAPEAELDKLAGLLIDGLLKEHFVYDAPFTPALVTR